jgi:phosphoribulokinase
MCWQVLNRCHRPDLAVSGQSGRITVRAHQQAKGILARSGKVTIEVAFDRLHRYARGHNLKISSACDLGRRLVRVAGLAGGCECLGE